MSTFDRINLYVRGGVEDTKDELEDSVTAQNNRHADDCPQ